MVQKGRSPMTEKLKILLIDDNSDDRALIKRELEKGFKNLEINEVEDPKGLKAALKKWNFDLVITDYHLQWSTGLKVFNAVKKEHPLCPVIMVTGTGNEEVAVEAMKKGLDDYVLKTVTHYKRLPASVGKALDHAIENLEKMYAEEKLRDAEMKYRTLVETLQEALGIVDENENIVFVNEGWSNIMGYTREEIIGKNLKEFLAKGEFKKVREETKKRRKGKTSKYLARMVHKDGREILTSVTASPWIDDRKKFKGTIGLMLDITEQTKAEETLKENEERFRVLFESSQEAIVIGDNDGNVIRVNNEFLKMFKLREGYILNKNIDDQITCKRSKKEAKSITKKVAKGKKMKFEAVRCRKDGTEINVSVLASPIIIHGKQVGVYGIYRDITKRKKTEAELEKHRDHLEELVEERTSELKKEIAERERVQDALNESEDRYRSLFQNLNVGVYRVTPGRDGRFIDVNPAFLKILGYRSKKELLKLKVKDIYSNPVDRNRFSKTISSNGSVRNEELHLKKKDGTPIIVIDNGTVVKDKKGKTLYFDGIIEDITEKKMTEEELREYRDHLEDLVGERTEELEKEIEDRKKIEESLRESEKKFRTLFESAPDAYYINDFNGNFLDGNRAAEKMLGVKRADVVGKSFLDLDLLSEEQLERAVELLERNINGESTGPDEFDLKRHDRETVPVEIRTIPGKIDGKDIILGIARDISERQRAEEALRESEERFRLLFENASEGIMFIDADGCIRSANPKVLDIATMEHDELVGKDAMELLDIFGVDPEVAMPMFQEMIEGVDPKHSEWDIINKFGKKSTVLASPSLIKKNGDVIGLVVILEDITDRKRNEQTLEALNKELIRANKLKDEILANTSHELRTPLNSIMGLLKLVIDGLFDNENEKEEFINIAYQNSKHLLAIINDLLDLARFESEGIDLDYEEMEISEIFDEMTLLFQKELEQRGLALVTVYPKDEFNKITCDKRRLKQVLSNLVNNAAKFTSDGDITIEAEPENTKWILFSVKDTGIGIKEKDMEKIFKPFLQLDGSSKRKYGGTGLGLPICKEMVEAMGGRIWLESDGEGKGTKFYFTVPRNP